MRAIVLKPHGPVGRTRGATAVLVVGEGLIGGAVTRRLRTRPLIAEAHASIDWGIPDFPTVADRLLCDVEAAAVEVVWAAGVFGMTSVLEVDRLTSSFETNLHAVIRRAESCAPVRVHLVSSAGALGCPSGDHRFKTIDSPYKAIKQAEEAIIESLSVPTRIHRVTSVFGTRSHSGRSGLVGALIANANRRQETALFARTTTMRNYIHADDVGEALVRGLLSSSNETTLLAATRSHPMNEVVASAERVLRRPIPVSYRPPKNHHDMVFSPRAVSDLVPQRSLAAGMRLVNDALASA